MAYENLLSGSRRSFPANARQRFRPVVEQLEQRLAMAIATGAHPVPEDTLYVNQYGDANVANTINVIGDTDTYATFFKVGGTVTFTTTSSIDPEMGYWDDTRNPNTRHAYSDDATGLQPLITHSGPAAFDDLAVQIGERFDDNTGNYNFIVNGPDQGATLINLSQVLTGTISHKNDFDLYTFSPPMLGTYQFTVGFYGATFDSTILLFNNSGNPVSGTFTSPLDAGGNDQVERVTFSVDVGSPMTIRVDGFMNLTGNYFINVDFVSNAHGIGAFDPGTGNWYLRTDRTAGAPIVPVFNFGGANWKPLVGDWNNDGVATVGVVDPGSSTWYLRDSNSSGAPNTTPFQYGAPGWVPLAGDWDGDGDTNIGVFDPGTATWYLRTLNSAGGPTTTPFQYGAPGWIPVVGDWDGNGTTTIGVVDPSTMTWYLKNSNGPGGPSFTQFQYGAPGWLPVVGDWDNNGTATVGAVNPNGQTWFLRNSNNGGAPDAGLFSYGGNFWRPVAGDYNGGGGAPLRAAAPGSGLDAGALGQADLDGIVAGALGRLEAQGLDSLELQRLVATQFVVADLSGLDLGLAYAGSNIVVIDADAAGHGWYVDPTPLQDGDAFGGRMDLLSAVLHELGHVAGLQHEDDGFMNAFLEPGVRHADLDAFFS